jgi:glycosyltransferase involved in cell wall biosynthesis
MKIIHLPDSYLPYYTGGKETFVRYLTGELKFLGHQNIIVIHQNDKIPANVKEYQYEGITVKVLPAINVNNKEYWRSEVTMDNSFIELLNLEKPDIVHFHDQSHGASLNHLRIVKSLGIPSLLTYHSPGQSCPQHSLLYRGKSICDGRLDAYRCSKCFYNSGGMPLILADILPLILFKPHSNTHNLIQRIFGVRSNIENFIDSFHEIYSLHDGIHVLCKWSKEILKLNGVPSNKIYMVRQGIKALDNNSSTSNLMKDRDSLHLAFVGRCTEIKGIHILIEAVKSLPDNLPVEVHFFGPYWEDTAYGRRMLKKIEGDRRFHAPVLLSPEQVICHLQQLDVLVVPSLCRETGPLVVLEALQAGIPVIGTRAGGIAEQIVDGENGLLFESGNSKELAKCIQEAWQKKVAGKSFNILPVRTAAEMAKEIEAIYNKLRNQN